MASVLREAWSDMRDAVSAFFAGLLCVVVSPVLLVLAAPMRVVVWMLSPFLAPFFMKVSDAVWGKIGAISRKEGNE